VDRRTFSKEILNTVTSFALIDSLLAFNAVGKNLKPITDLWAKQLNEYCSDLKSEAITTIQWQKKVEELYTQVELKEILKFIDFENLRKGIEYPDLGVATKTVKFPKLVGLPEKTVFGKKIFGMKKGRAIIPHGHSNMASAHIILHGEMHLWHYDKIGENELNLFIKPTVDRTAKVGESSSISDEKDNIHWFIANTATAFTFDVIIQDLHHKAYDIHNLDMQKAEKSKNGILKVPIIDVETALKKYGKQHHFI
jgi:thiol-disulfide isomerase/thioredoxin